MATAGSFPLWMPWRRLHELSRDRTAASESVRMAGRRSHGRHATCSAVSRKPARPRDVESCAPERPSDFPCVGKGLLIPASVALPVLCLRKKLVARKVWAKRAGPWQDAPS